MKTMQGTWKKEFPIWDTDLYTGKLIQKDIEHSLIIKFWIIIRGIKNRN